MIFSRPIGLAEAGAPIIFRLYEYWDCARADHSLLRTGNSPIPRLTRADGSRPAAKLKLLIAISLLVVSAAILAGCGELPQTIMDPAGDNARQTLDLFIIILVGAAIILLGVEGWLIYALIAYRRRAGNDAIPPQTHGNNKLEAVWTAVPTAIVIALAVITIRTISIQAAEPGPDALRVNVWGNQWWWEFEYPAEGVIYRQ